jgi:hypothetical protein
VLDRGPRGQSFCALARTYTTQAGPGGDLSARRRISRRRPNRIAAPSARNVPEEGSGTGEVETVPPEMLSMVPKS